MAEGPAGYMGGAGLCSKGTGVSLMVSEMKSWNQILFVCEDWLQGTSEFLGLTRLEDELGGSGRQPAEFARRRWWHTSGHM